MLVLKYKCLYTYFMYIGFFIYFLFCLVNLERYNLDLYDQYGSFSP